MKINKIIINIGDEGMTIEDYIQTIVKLLGEKDIDRIELECEYDGQKYNVILTP